MLAEVEDVRDVEDVEQVEEVRRGCGAGPRPWPARLHDLLEERGQLLLVKGREAAEQDVEDDAGGPQVNRT